MPQLILRISICVEKGAAAAAGAGAVLDLTTVRVPCFGRCSVGSQHTICTVRFLPKTTCGHRSHVAVERQGWLLWLLKIASQCVWFPLSVLLIQFSCRNRHSTLALA